MAISGTALAIAAGAAAGAGIGSVVAHNNDKPWWQGALLGGVGGAGLGVGAIALGGVPGLVGLGGLGGMFGGAGGGLSGFLGSPMGQIVQRAVVGSALGGITQGKEGLVPGGLAGAVTGVAGAMVPQGAPTAGPAAAGPTPAPDAAAQVIQEALDKGSISQETADRELERIYGQGVQAAEKAAGEPKKTGGGGFFDELDEFLNITGSRLAQSEQANADRSVFIPQPKPQLPPNVPLGSLMALLQNIGQPVTRGALNF